MLRAVPLPIIRRLFTVYSAMVYVIQVRRQLSSGTRMDLPVVVKNIPRISCSLENVECCKYLGSILTNDGRCTCEIKSRIATANAAFNKKKTFFNSKFDLNLRKKLVKCYTFKHGFLLCWNLDASGSRSENLGRLESDAREGWRRSVGPIMWEMKKWRIF
jgi:hypothetical protein